MADAGVEGVAGAGDQIAGDDGYVGPDFDGGVDGARQFAFAEENAEVDVAELHKAKAVEVVGESWQRHVDFPHAKIRALHQSPVAQYGERAGHSQSAGHVERPAASAIGFGIQMLAEGPDGQANAHRRDCDSGVPQGRASEHNVSGSRDSGKRQRRR